MALYAATFSNEDELVSAARAKKLGDEAGEYKNWVAVITNDRSLNNITIDSVPVGKEDYKFFLWKDYEQIVYGSKYKLPNEDVLLLENGDTLTWEDGKLIEFE